VVYRPFSLTEAREYYGPSRQDPRDQQATWSHRPPTPFYPEQNRLGTAALVGAGIVGSGFLPAGGGKRVWDYYVKGMRGIEEYSPGGVLRTFQMSPFFSQFGTEHRGLQLSAKFLEHEDNKHVLEYLTGLIGEKTKGGDLTYAKLLREGVELKRGQLLFGGGDVALRRASAYTFPVTTSPKIGSGYARSRGLPHGIRIGEEIQQQIIGGHNIFQHWWRQATGLGTTYVTRFNDLLKAPFELEPFKTVFGTAQTKLGDLTEKFGRRRIIQLAVPEGSGMQMMGRLTMKYGLALGAVALGYQTLDYMTREADLLDDTAFDQGITAGVATVGVKSNLAISRFAEVTGLHDLREAQEELAPGSTSLGTLAAFPLIGGLFAASSVYMARVAKTAKFQMAGADVAVAAARAKEELQAFGGTLGHLGEQISKPTGLYSREDWVGKVFRKLATEEGDELSYKFFGKIGPAKLMGILGAGVGLAAVTPFIAGALIPGTRPDELERIYSGEQEVAVRKGRWWEFGRSPYEGNRISYFRPHWYPRMQMRARETALYGEDEGSPIENWFKREFTYEWEKEHYYDRPYPITALPFEDVPLVGPILAATLGRLIKPEKLMHTEEWMDEEMGVKAPPPAFGARPVTELGEEAPGAPISPYSLKGTIGEQAYRMTEMIGLPGFTMTSIKEALTGTPELFDQYTQLESARRAFGAERAYWDLEVGGGLGTTEALRRLYPHRRRQVPLYNPIRNLMPEWLPGPGEKSPDFLHGDPYTKVQEGELRLPGEGYAQRFPELKGLTPEEYPLIHRYKILADVAPYTDKFKQTARQISSERKLKTWTEYEENIYQTTREQVKQRKIRKEFEEYEYLSPTGKLFDEPQYYGGEEGSALIAKMNELKKSGEEEPGVIRKIFGSYWELLAHNAETTVDVLTPISPGAKLVHTRTAIEDYSRTQAYGTENAFWQHPWRDFLRPFGNLTAKAFGFDGIPDHIEDKRALEEHFDILKYVKNARLANLARMAGDTEAVKEFETKKDETLFGLNPYTFNFRSIFRALPRRERDYFNSFAAAETVEERAEILKMVPENERALYIARWKMQFAQEVKKAKKAGQLSEDELTEAEQIIDDTYKEARHEGFPTSKELFAEYVETRLKGETYADWYRRTKLLDEVPLPGPDWVGWHPSVDLDDIKLKVVQNLGEDMHEYDLWPSDARGLANRPYINDDAVREVMAPEDMSNVDQQARLRELFSVEGLQYSMFTRNTMSGDSKTEIEIEQEHDLESLLSRMI
jgi:hypothetical protein